MNSYTRKVHWVILNPCCVNRENKIFMHPRVKITYKYEIFFILSNYLDSKLCTTVKTTALKYFYFSLKTAKKSFAPQTPDWSWADRSFAVRFPFIIYLTDRFSANFPKSVWEWRALMHLSSNCMQKKQDSIYPKRYQTCNVHALTGAVKNFCRQVRSCHSPAN